MKRMHSTNSNCTAICFLLPVFCLLSLCVADSADTQGYAILDTPPSWTSPTTRALAQWFSSQGPLYPAYEWTGGGRTLTWRRGSGPASQHTDPSLLSRKKRIFVTKKREDQLRPALGAERPWPVAPGGRSGGAT